MLICLFVQAEEMIRLQNNLNLLYSFIVGAIPVIVAVFWIGRAYVSRKEMNDLLDKKLDKTRFDYFYEEVMGRIDENKAANEMQHRLLLEDIKDSRNVNKETLDKLIIFSEKISILSEKLAVVANNTSWIKGKIDKH